MSDRADWLLLLPPSWFVGFQRVLLGSVDPWFVRLATIAIAASLLASSIVAGVYVVLFRHFEHLLLRPPSVSPGWFGRHAAGSSAGGVSISALWITGPGSPAFRAVQRFITATLARSQLHQAVVLGLSACGLSLVVSRLIGSNLISHVGSNAPPSSLLVNAATWTPFAVMFVCGISIRAAVALPMTHQANWIFRLTETEDGRREQMRAVDQVVTAYVVGLPLAVALPVMWLVFGAADAIIGAIIVAGVGFLFVHVVLLDWRRIPFTCTYIPGKRLVAHTLVFGFAAFALFTSTGALVVHVSTVKPSVAAGMVIFLSGIAWVLRRRRFAMWRETPLIFDDDLPDQPVQLGL
jgi:hypothetical protein